MYPERNKIHMITTKTANSTGEVTMDFPRDVTFPEIGLLEGERCGALMDDFKGHSKPVLSDYITRFLSANDRTPEQERYRLCEWLIMAGRIICKSQPIDIFLGKCLKVNYGRFYDM